MKRDEAERLALIYCRRNVEVVRADARGRTRAQAERIVIAEACYRYGSTLTKVAQRRIRQALRASR